MVLLKNEKNILPLSNKIKTLAVIGPLAKDQTTCSVAGRAMARSRMWNPFMRD